MKNINEVEVLTNIRLSNTQKYVLTKLVAAETPLTAYESVSQGANVVAARDQLTKLGLMNFQNNEAHISENGMSALKDEALVDETGELTEQGQQYAYAESVEDVQNHTPQNKQPEEPEAENNTTIQQTQDTSLGPPIPPITGQGEVSPMESWSMIHDIEMDLNQKKFLKKHSR